jgi:endonuclease G
MKTIFLTLVTLLSLSVYSQKKLRDNITIKSDIFEIVYSEVLEQPKYVKYVVLCPNGKASRTGMDFYTNDSIKTSDDTDYKNNIYDKGHMAPAADFNCTKEMLYKTFSYLNCSLQEQTLNRTTWRLLEQHERDLAQKCKVYVEIQCIFSLKSIRLKTGGVVPDGYYKKIRYSNKVEIYYFKNEKPTSTDYTKYRTL